MVAGEQVTGERVTGIQLIVKPENSHTSKESEL